MHRTYCAFESFDIQHRFVREPCNHTDLLQLPNLLAALPIDTDLEAKTQRWLFSLSFGSRVQQVLYLWHM